MELSRSIAAVRRWWWVLVLASALAGATAFAVSRRLPAVYRAQATLIINLANQQLPTYQDVIAGQTISTTYAHVVTARPTLETAANRLGSGATSSTISRVKASIIPQSELIQISFEATDAAFAARVVNTVAQVAVEQVQTLQANDAAAGSGAAVSPGVATNSMQVLEPAFAPGTPVSPNVRLDAVLGALVGLVIAIGVVLLLDRLDDSIRDPAELAELGLATLTSIPRVSKHNSEPLSVLEGRVGPNFTESFRQLEVNLALAGYRRRSFGLVVVSTRPREGKTTTACNLAIMLARSGRHVVVVDTHLQRPDVHRFFGLPNPYGLSSALLSDDGMAALPSLLQTTSIANLQILAAGPEAPDQGDLFLSARMQELMAALAAQDRIVIYDSQTSSTAAEAAALASGAQAVLAVVEAGRSRRKNMLSTLHELRRSGKPVVGVALNQVAGNQWPLALGPQSQWDATVALPMPQSADPIPAPPPAPPVFIDRGAFR